MNIITTHFAERIFNTTPYTSYTLCLRPRNRTWLYYEGLVSYQHNIMYLRILFDVLYYFVYPASRGGGRSMRGVCDPGGLEVSEPLI